VCGLLLTRPTYQGVACVTGRLKEVVELCHSKGVPIIVDEAHGSHLRFLDNDLLQGAQQLAKYH
jgi:lysine decarboxylase